jgi:hypothetical protein
MVTPAAKREAVAHLVETYETSERRASRPIRADRKTARYHPRRPKDEALRRRLRELAAGQHRFGYRLLHADHPGCQAPSWNENMKFFLDLAINRGLRHFPCSIKIHAGRSTLISLRKRRQGQYPTRLGVYSQGISADSPALSVG